MELMLEIQYNKVLKELLIRADLTRILKDLNRTFRNIENHPQCDCWKCQVDEPGYCLNKF